MRCIVSAYYYHSEANFAFGPFTERQLLAFIAKDPRPDMHDEWFATWFNPPADYNTGNERTAH